MYMYFRSGYIVAAMPTVHSGVNKAWLFGFSCNLSFFLINIYIQERIHSKMRTAVLDIVHLKKADRVSSNM